MLEQLYVQELLALSKACDGFSRLPSPMGSATKHARLCGSTVTVDVNVFENRISALGMEADACALGRASAAILARDGIGATLEELEDGLSELKHMLKTGEPPAAQNRFAALHLLQSAKDAPQRHGSILLAFEAAIEAFQQVIESE
jgi:NifU-like protein involved in Fe-S cluster formation